tara:strand:- start:134 stop:454 length:321 start_codon:yes stop_codon:yes gene_type:complete
MLSVGHAKCLLSINNQNDQLDIYNLIISKNLSVRETEKLTSEKPNQNIKINNTITLSKKLIKEQKNLEEILDASVQIKSFKNGGWNIQITCNSVEELNKIINVLKT